MNSAPKHRAIGTIELQESVSELQPLRQYFDLLKTSFEWYEYLKKLGVSEETLYTEKGLIDRQIRFLSKACNKLTGSARDCKIENNLWRRERM